MEEKNNEKCAMLNCFYNDDFNCLSIGDLRNPELFEDCPEFVED